MIIDSFQKIVANKWISVDFLVPDIGVYNDDDESGAEDEIEEGSEIDDEEELEEEAEDGE